MSIVYCSASNIIDNICDTVPLEKLKYYSANKPALPYIAWGLIWDNTGQVEISKQKGENRFNSTIWDELKFKNRKDS